MRRGSTTRLTTVRKAAGSAGTYVSYNPIEENADIYTKMTIEENADIFTKKNLRTRANDVRNRGEHIAGWGFDPSWEKGSLQMASLVFDATKPLECPLEL